MFTPFRPLNGIHFSGDNQPSHGHQSQPDAAEQERVQLRLAYLRSREEHLEPEQLAELADLNEAQRLQRAIEEDRLADEDVREASRLHHLRQAFATNEHPPLPPRRLSSDRFEHQNASPPLPPRRSATEHFEHQNSASPLHPRQSIEDYFELRNPSSPLPTRRPADASHNGQAAGHSENENMNLNSRLAHLSNREEHLSDAELAELSDLREAQRLQRDIEQDKLADEDVREAVRLAHLRRGFESRTSGQNTHRQPPASHPRPIRQETSHRRHTTAPSDEAVNTSTSSSPGASRGMSGMPLSTHDLFGRNLSEVTLQQRNNSTCYLLSAFDAILHHPQGERILSLIRVNRVEDGYQVKFPGHPEPIHIPEDDLQGRDVPTSSHIGIPILWNAYLKLPGALDKHRNDTTNDALRRMFGNRVAPALETIDTTVAESNRQRHSNTDSADIWTVTRVVRNSQGRRIDTGKHYFSIRPNRDGSYALANPGDTQTPEMHFNNQETLAKEFNPELTRIRID